VEPKGAGLEISNLVKRKKLLCPRSIPAWLVAEAQTFAERALVSFLARNPAVIEPMYKTNSKTGLGHF